MTRYNFDVSPELEKVIIESSQEREYRLKNAEYDANHKRWRGTIFFIATIIALAYVFLLCVQIISNPNATPDDKKWATAIITSIVSGSIGFIAGKAIPAGSRQRRARLIIKSI